MAHGRNAVLKLDNESDALTAITSWCRDVKFPQEAETVEGTTMGSKAVERAAGLKDSSFEIEGVSDSTIDGYLDHALARAKTVQWNPKGTSAGRVRKSGEFIGSEYEISIDFESEVTFSFTAEQDGVITKDTN